MNAVGSGYVSVYPAISANNPKEMRTFRQQLIRDVALSSLKEMAAIIVITAVASPFVATAAGISLLINTSVIIAVTNTIYRAISAYSSYQAKTLEKKPSSDNFERSAHLEISKFCNLVAPLQFGYLNYSTTTVLIHECGHSAAALALFKNSHPKITIFPFAGGVTTFQINQLSLLGRFLGERISLGILFAAGTAAALIASTVELVAAHYIRPVNEKISLYLNISAITTISQHAFYALSALLVKATDFSNSTHDFVVLWMTGIHPVVSAIAIVAIPLIVKGAIYAAQRKRERKLAGAHARV